MSFRVTHTTTYAYGSEITTAHNQARLAPRNSARQSRRSFALEVFPVPDDMHEFTDFFGNRADHFSIHTNHRKLVVRAVSEVELKPLDLQLDFDAIAAQGTWENAALLLQSSTERRDLDARQFLLDSPLVHRSNDLADFARGSFLPGRSVVEAYLDLNHRIAREFRYQPGTTTTTTGIEEVLEKRRGVCQDFAHLAIGCLRSVGLPARYVSGYIETTSPQGQDDLRGADASHAWVSGYVPGWGWLDFDPTNDVVPKDQHITTAWGRDYGDVAPLRGIVFSGGGGHTMDVAVEVTRLPA